MKACKHCENPFEGRKNGQYCSDKCRDERQRQRRIEACKAFRALKKEHINAYMRSYYEAKLSEKFRSLTQEQREERNRYQREWRRKAKAKESL